MVALITIGRRMHLEYLRSNEAETNKKITYKRFKQSNMVT